MMRRLHGIHCDISGGSGSKSASHYCCKISFKLILMKTNITKRLRSTALSLIAIGALMATPAAFAQIQEDDDGPSVAVPEGGSLAPIFAVTVAGVCIAAWRFKKK